MPGRIVNDEALDALFRTGRSHYAWLARPVGDTLLRALWELVKLPPASPLAPRASTVFVRSQERKADLAAAVAGQRADAILTAPVAAIVGCRRDQAKGPPPAWRDAATLQAGYLILAARALGLDCGPIWEFDARAVDAAFFSDGTLASAFVCALGYGDETRLPATAAAEAPAGDGEEACAIL